LDAALDGDGERRGKAEGEIERTVAGFARVPNGGLIVTPGSAGTLYLNLIITLAARHKLPAVYYERSQVAAGGLISYGSRLCENVLSGLIRAL
jgi:putative ABC transport system substrate-binding protein